MEEANILASKGKGPVEETRVIPSQLKGNLQEKNLYECKAINKWNDINHYIFSAEDTGGFYEFTSHSQLFWYVSFWIYGCSDERVVKTDLNGPGWVKRKSRKEIADIEKASDFIKVIYCLEDKDSVYRYWRRIFG